MIRRFKRPPLGLGPQPLFSSCFLVFIAGLPVTALSDEEASPPAVAEVPAEARPVAVETAAIEESPALFFAQRDAARLAEQAESLREQARLVGEEEDEDTDDAEKAAAEAEARAKAAAEKVAFFEKTPPQADPEAIRLAETFEHDRSVISCRFDAAGDYLFAGAFDESVQRWETLTGERTTLEGHRSWVRRFDLHAETGLLVTGDYSGNLIWWDSLDPAPQPRRVVEAHAGYVRGVSVSPDGRFVATGGNDNLVKVWCAEEGRLIAELPGHERHVYNVRFHPDGGHLISGDLMGVLKQWEVGSWKHVRDLDAGVLSKYDSRFRADCGGIRGMDFSPDGRQLAVCGISEVTNAFAGVGVPTAVLFDWETGERLQVMTPDDNFTGTCWSVRFHPSGEFLVGAGGRGSGMLWFWKPDAEEAFFAFKLPQVGYDLSFHPDTLRLAVALYDKTVRIYDLGPELEE